MFCGFLYGFLYWINGNQPTIRSHRTKADTRKLGSSGTGMPNCSGPMLPDTCARYNIYSLLVHSLYIYICVYIHISICIYICYSIYTCYYIYVTLYIYMLLYIYVTLYIYTCYYIYMLLYIYIYMLLYTYIYMLLYIYMCYYIYMLLYIYVTIYICYYIYMYIYKYLHIYIYILYIECPSDKNALLINKNRCSHVFTNISIKPLNSITFCLWFGQPLKKPKPGSRICSQLDLNAHMCW